MVLTTIFPLVLSSISDSFYLAFMFLILIALIRSNLDMSKKEKEYQRRSDEAYSRFLRAVAENEKAEQEYYRHAHQRKVLAEQHREIIAKSKAIPKHKTKTLPKI